MQVDPKPNVELLPKVFNRSSRLRCSGGWSDEATLAFLSGGFDCLELKCGPQQEFWIPDLGSAAKDLREAELRVAGRLSGFEQFESLCSITLPSGVPQGGLDLGVFARLHDLTFDCTGGSADILSGCEKLSSLGVIGWPEANASKFGQVKGMEQLAISQGRIQTLRGLEELGSLKNLSLAYVRNLADLSSLTALNRLTSLDLENVPKLLGTLHVSTFDSLKVLRVVSCPLVVDLEGLDGHADLEVLWLNGECANLDWSVLLSAPKLRMAAIPVGEADKSMIDRIAAMAASSARNVQKLELVGPKRARILQMVLG